MFLKDRCGSCFTYTFKKVSFLAACAFPVPASCPPGLLVPRTLQHFPPNPGRLLGLQGDVWATGTLHLCHSQVVALASSRKELSLSVGSLQLEHRSDLEHKRRDFTSCGRNKKLYLETHTLVHLLEENGFTIQQAEITVCVLVKIRDISMDIVYKDMVTKMQQEMAVQQRRPQTANVKNGIILEKSEFSALKAEKEKINLELQQLKQEMNEVIKVQTDSKLDFNLYSGIIVFVE